MPSAPASWRSSSNKPVTNSRPMVDEHRNRVWSVLTVEHYSGLKKKEILIQATTRTSLVDSTFSEVSQSQKGQSCRTHPCEVAGGAKPTETERRRWGWGWGRGGE